ncbi:hypothetical protein HYW76_01515 [Candidatus Pacearchaeota archaeon]|nr:hypothetical protein [Candidatus Pacearchaeota archaeon]
MAHQCVHCSKIYPNASKELIEGCSCGSHFFFYIKDESYEKLKKEKVEVLELPEEGKRKIEEEVREIAGIEEEEPIILDLESVRVIGPGKFEIDVVNLFSGKRPLIYKLGEGKYIIDLAYTFKKSSEELDKKDGIGI